jgi:hypothetical protein
MKGRKRVPKPEFTLPGESASYEELSDFFDRTSSVDLLKAGVLRFTDDNSNLDRMLAHYWNQPNTQQVNIRIPPGAKKIIDQIAKRKTIDVSTLVRLWVIDGMRREAKRL